MINDIIDADVCLQTAYSVEKLGILCTLFFH